MDSKYTLVGKNGSNSTVSNLKRKFSYGSSNSVPSKKLNLQPTKPVQPSIKSNASQNDRTVVKDIQQQRRQLPVYAVKES